MLVQSNEHLEEDVLRRLQATLTQEAARPILRRADRTFWCDDGALFATQLEVV